MRNNFRKGSDKPDRGAGRRKEYTGERPSRKKSSSDNPGEERESKPFRKYPEKTGRSGRSSGYNAPGESGPGKGKRPYRSGSDKPAREKPFHRKDFDRSEEKPFRKEREDRPYNRESGPKPYRRKEQDRPEEKPFRKEREERPYNRESGPKPYRRKEQDRPEEKPFRKEREERPYNRESGPKPYRRKEQDRPEEKPFRKEREDRPYNRESGPKPYRRREQDRPEEKPFREERERRSYNREDRPKSFPGRERSGGTSKTSRDGLTRLNKYIANAGICSRREADELIQAGVIKVNGKIITELGYKIGPGDRVQYEDQPIRSEKLVYVLLNKPKGYITTADDPFERKTVMTLVEDACKERIYPVGRLDRNTSGLLLFTNDGDLAKKLTHPKHNIRKVYHVELDKALVKADMMKIAEGVELEDGVAEVDEIAYAEGSASKKEIGIELHSGRNRIVRRIFESLGYDVVKLDRVIFAGLTKKDLPRGHWRMLTDKEVNYLKMIR